MPKQSPLDEEIATSLISFAPRTLADLHICNWSSAKVFLPMLRLLRFISVCTTMPVAFYSDKHSVFRFNQPSVGSQSDLSQFGLAMQQLFIAILCANTPQAKGRVERVI